MRLVSVALAWSLGLVLASSLTARHSVLWAALAAAAVLVLWLQWPHAPRRNLAALLLVVTLGGWRMALVPVSSPVAGYNQTGGLTLEGEVSAVAPDAQGVWLTLETQQAVRGGSTMPTSGRVQARVDSVTAVIPGDIVQLTGLLYPPDAGATGTTRDRLARSSVYSEMPNAALVIVRPGDPSFARELWKLRQQIGAQIGRALPEPHAALLTGILIGDDHLMPPDVVDAFAASGAAHLIAVSGFNMIVVSSVTDAVLRRLKAGRWVSVVASLIIILLYALLAGGSAAVLRAAVMSGLVLVGRALRRRAYIPASLAFAVLVLSLLDPFAPWDLGFQLSLAATLGIGLWADQLGRGIDRLLARRFSPNWAARLGDLVTEPLAVGLAAQALTLPLILAAFGRLSLMALPVNLLVAPVQAPLMLLGAAAVAVSTIAPALGQLLFWGDGVLLGWTLTIVRGAARLPLADIGFGLPPRAVALAFSLGIGWLMMDGLQLTFWQRMNRWAAARPLMLATLFAAGLAIGAAGAVVASRADGQLHVWFLDVGHSNAVLMQTPAGAQILVDGGRNPARLLGALGDRMPFNDRQIDLLVLTEPDENEYSALTLLAERYDVGLVLSHGQPNQSESFAALRERLQTSPWQVVHAGDSFTLSDGVAVEILYPTETPALEDSLDDHALTLRVHYGGVSILLPGDLSRDGQTALLEHGRWPLAQVMQLPHHGAARGLSDAFLAAVQPQLIVVQADTANRLGEPDPDVMAALPEVPVLRTDQRGTVHLWTDGQHLWTDPG